MTYANAALSSADGIRPQAHATGSAEQSRKTSSRVIATLYLAGFLAYGTGFAMVSSIVGTPGFLSNIAEHATTLALGAVLMLLTIVTDVWRAVVFFPVLGERGRSTALTYFGAQMVSVVMFFVGVLGLLLIVPLGAYATGASGAANDWADALASLLVQFNGIAYQVAQFALAFGSLALWFYGFRSRLIPRAFAAWAIVGYIALFVGSVAELFGLHISMTLLIPGALFELALPVWLYAKGFSAEGYGKAA